jgi:hypothetical protein
VGVRVKTFREELAEAANTVEGLDVSPTYRQSLAPKQGLVRFARRDRPQNGFGWLETWQVWIAMAQDLYGAELALEVIQDELMDALGDVMTVTSLVPSDLVLPNNPIVPGIVVEGVRGV